MAYILLEVDCIDLALRTGAFPYLGLSVSGSANSDGWREPKLVPWRYLEAPEDGIYAFDFVASPPTGNAESRLYPLATHYEWSDFPSDLRGVRVHATNNQMQAMLSSDLLLV